MMSSLPRPLFGFVQTAAGLTPGQGGSSRPTTLRWIGRRCHFAERLAAYVYENIFSTAEETTVDLPEGYLLSAPYPNPFNPRAVVPFEVPGATHVRLTLVDIFGREVATLLDGQVNTGNHEAVLDGGRVASGVYLVRLEAEGVIHATQKVLLLR